MGHPDRSERPGRVLPSAGPDWHVAHEGCTDAIAHPGAGAGSPPRPEDGPMTENSAASSGSSDAASRPDGIAILRLMGGAGRIEIRSDPAIGELFRSSHEPGAPEVVVEGDRVTVRYAIHRLLGKLATNELTDSRFALSSIRTWDIQVPDGVTGIDADLSTGRLAGMRVGHGGGTVRLRLPRPTGTVPVAVGGGAREVIVFRPAGVMVRVATSGDVARVIIDGGRPIGPLAGNTTVEPPGYALAEDRYDISVSGGCESVLVATAPASAR